MLLHAMLVKAVDPKDRVFDAVTDAVGPFVLGHLHQPTHTKRAQSSVVECGGTNDVRDSNACVVDHRDTLGLERGTLPRDFLNQRSNQLSYPESRRRVAGCGSRR
jgi:hypothetical protein